MRSRSWTIGLLCVCGCGSAERSSASDAGDAAAVGGIAFTGSVLGDGHLLAGVEVCQDEPHRCTLSDDNGRFVLDGLMPEREILLVYRKEGFRSLLKPMLTPRWSSGSHWLQSMYRWTPPDAENALLRGAGLPELPGGDVTKDSTATIVFGAFSDSPHGNELTDQVRVELDPPSGFGPFFYLDSGPFQLDVPAGQAASFGYFRAVAPREEGYELVYTHSRGDCRHYAGPEGGWPATSDRSNATRVPARAGYLTVETDESCLSADASTADAP